MRASLLISFSLMGITYLHAQDSTTAKYINDLVEQIGSRMEHDIKLSRDTLIYEEEDSLRKEEPLRISVQYYINPGSGKVDKVVEKSRYRDWTTVLEIFYHLEKPIRVTNTRWNKAKMVLDFDVYYIHDNAVHFTRRDPGKGKPDGQFFLRWCYDLLKEYRKHYVAPEPIPASSQTKKNKKRSL